MSQTRPKLYLFVGLAVATSATIFVVDIDTPLGIAVGVTYFIPVFLVSRIRSLYPIVFIAGGCSILVILGLHYSPMGADIWQVWMNRALSLLVIWSAAYFFTKRNQAEVALTQAAERFSSAFEQSLIPMSLVDSSGALIQFNTAYTELLGYPETELMNTDFKSVTHKDDLKLELPLYEKMVAGEIDSYSLEKRYVRRSGEIIWVAVQAAIVRDIEGKPYQVIGQYQDITSRKLTEDELRRFECIASNSSDLMALMDTDYIYWTVNSTYLQAFNKNRDEIIGLSAPEVFGQDFFDAVIKPNALRCMAGESVQFQSWYDLPNVTRRYLDVIYSRYFGEDNSIDGFVVIARDITDRKEAEDALEKARNQNRQILEAAGEGIYGVDPDGVITFINPAGAAMLGYDRDDAVGHLAHDVLHHAAPIDASHPITECPIHVAFKDGEIRHIDDEVFWKKDGSSFPVDYVSTPIVENDEISGAVVVFRDTTEALRLSEQLLHQATHDGLTGLVNRLDFDQQMSRFLDPARTHEREAVLAYLDLDQFKLINDTCGHLAGDELLRQLAVMMAQQLRASDTLARLGGDEFGVLMTNCSIERAQVVMNRIREGIAEFRFVWDEKSFTIGVSIGLVSLAADTIDAAEALRRADAACYAAKDGGRNRIHVYREDDRELAKSQGEMQWVARINDAISNDKFQLYAQPIISLAKHGDRQEHYEILLRMKDGENETISPATFLPAAERYNLSPLVDRWVVKTTFEWLALHQHQLNDVEFWCINLSGLSLGDETTLTFITEQLNRAQFRPESICFEVTETTAITNLADASNFIKALKSYGCKFALDDFGSGLSSFGYLKNLPVDFLKIDGIFVKDIVDDPIDYAMVKSINEIGHVMGMKTIAEFVENDAILKKLQEINVDYAQGYGIGRPQPLDELIPLAVAS